jgi:hypothetical protein
MISIDSINLQKRLQIGPDRSDAETNSYQTFLNAPIYHKKYRTDVSGNLFTDDNMNFYRSCRRYKRQSTCIIKAARAAMRLTSYLYLPKILTFTPIHGGG